MFKRRIKPSTLRYLRNWVIPESGWKRRLQYLRHRMLRLNGTPHSIAFGFACGVAVSFTPFVGLHLIVSGFIAWALGGNFIAAWLGTGVGNPWTFPLIWLGTYKVGKWIVADPTDMGMIGPNPQFHLADLLNVILPMAIGYVIRGVRVR